MFKEIKIGILIITISIVLAGCTFPWEKERVSVTPEGSEPTTSNILDEEKSFSFEMKKFANAEELQLFLQKNAIGGGMTVATGNELANKDKIFISEDPDIMKTDGKFIYTVVKNEVLIINAEVANQASVVGRIAFKSPPENLFISEGRLVVIGNDYKFFENPISDSFKRRGNYLFLKVFDISNPAAPKELRNLNFEGNFASGRLLGSYIYLITNNPVSIDSKTITPRILEDGKIITSCAEPQCVVPMVYYFDTPYASYNYVSVNAISLNNEKEVVGSQIYLVNSPENLYVSVDNIYLTSSQTISDRKIEQEIRREKVFSKLAVQDQEKIKKIESVSSYILSKDEKEMKIANVFDEYLASLDETGRATIKEEIDASLVGKIKSKMKELEKTLVYKIALKGGKPEYRAKGNIQGNLLTSALDEKNGYLRLITTRNSLWSKLFEDSSKFYSNVYILDENLTQLGSLENIATEAPLQSARLMESRAYLITTDRSDPLYVVDLSEKTKPAILGAVKIPGYTTYLQAADKLGTKIIGFGRDYEEVDGMVKMKGLKLSLFDFSDLSKPKELSSYSIGEESSDSIALESSRAFLYSETKNLISVPGVFEKDGKINFSGALTFSIENDLLKLNGKINHLSSNPQAIFNINNLVKRSLYLGDNLYTISNKYIKVNNLTDLSELKSVILTPGEEDYNITAETPGAISNTSTSSPDGAMPNNSLENPSASTETPSSLSEVPAEIPASPQETATGSPEVL